MLRTRRGFFDVLAPGRAASGTAALLAMRGHEAYVAELAAQGRTARPPLPPGVNEIRISSNENPLGPGQRALDAIAGKFPEAGRYPFNSSPSDRNLVEELASRHKVKADHIVLGAGSQEILKSAVRAFTSPARALVTASPTFENPTGTARRLGHAIREVRVDSQFRLDIDGMVAATAAGGTGLVFFNNPNNPTATVHSLKTVTEFVARVRKAAPDAMILIDEAYHEYVTDPAYQTAIPLALDTPNVFVVRTFSKAYGMAGMRIGWAIGRPETIRPLSRLKMPYNVSVFGVAAALAALGDPAHIEAERKRNTEVRNYTVKVLTDLGAKPTDSQGNFLFVDIGRPAATFREACAKEGVMVGRNFPPFENSHARISIGTMDEMKRAAAVFRNALKPITTAGRER
jgi:histidinol-phosphate aminotransferase